MSNGAFFSAAITLWMFSCVACSSAGAVGTADAVGGGSSISGAGGGLGGGGQGTAEAGRDSSGSAGDAASGAGGSPLPAAGGSSAGAQGTAQAGSNSAGGISGAAAAGNGGSGGAPELLGARPPMGWESWWSTHTNVETDADVRAVADILASKFASFGYQYLLIYAYGNTYDEYGRLKPDPKNWPNGLKAVADYLHGKGLKLGVSLTPGVNDSVVAANSPIYGTTYHVKDIITSAPGNTDKASGDTARQIDFTKPGAVEYVQTQADMFASWGVDHVKFDFVGPGGGGGNASNQPDVMQWRAALDKTTAMTGREVFFNLSNKLSISAIATWQKYSNAWRVENDDECYCSTNTNWAHVIREIDGVFPFQSDSGPGHWNDLDSVLIGQGTFDGLTPDERQTTFSFWSIVCSPLMIGSDLTKLDSGDYAILTNPEIIAVDQAGIPGKAISTSTQQQVWYSKQADGSVVVGLFNFGATSAAITVKLSDVGAGSTMNVRDLVTRTALGASSGSFSATLPTHASRMLKLSAP